MKILDNTNNTINSVSQRYIQLSKIKKAFRNSFFNGGERARTVDLLLAKQALSQLSYTPWMVGLVGFEPTTSPLSGVRSNQLSYRPAKKYRYQPSQASCVAVSYTHLTLPTKA